MRALIAFVASAVLAFGSTALADGYYDDEYDGSSSASSGPSSGPFSGPSGPFGPGFYIRSSIGLSYYSSDMNEGLLWNGRTNLGYYPGGERGGTGIGFALGIDTIADEDDTFQAFYPVVKLGTNFGTFQAGIPRSVIDSRYLPRVNFAYSNFADVFTRQISGSFVGNIYLFAEETPVGLRYDHRLGDLKVGASWHRIETPFADIDAYAGAIGYRTPRDSGFPRFKVGAAVEHLTDGSSDQTTWHLGGAATWDRVQIGARYTNLESDLSVTQAYVDYEITPRFSANLAAIQLSDSIGDETLYGIGLKYRLIEHVSLHGSYLRDDDGEDLFEFGTKLRF